MAPGVWLKVSQIDGPRPSSATAPSIWYAAVAVPKTKPGGKRRPSSITPSQYGSERAGRGRAGPPARPGQAPIRLLPSAIRQIDTTDGRGLLPSGQVEAGLSYVEPSSSPGCCTAMKTVRWSLVIHGPQVSAPRGTVANCLT